jgi:hypothetical protein
VKTGGLIDPDVIAEDAEAWLPARPSTERLDAGDVVLWHVRHSPQFWYGSATPPRNDRSVAERRISDSRRFCRWSVRSECGADSISVCPAGDQVEHAGRSQVNVIRSSDPVTRT